MHYVPCGRGSHHYCETVTKVKTTERGRVNVSHFTSFLSTALTCFEQGAFSLQPLTATALLMHSRNRGLPPSPPCFSPRAGTSSCSGRTRHHCYLWVKSTFNSSLSYGYICKLRQISASVLACTWSHFALPISLQISCQVYISKLMNELTSRQVCMYKIHRLPVKGRAFLVFCTQVGLKQELA